jgi:hypothetical protein
MKTNGAIVLSAIFLAVTAANGLNAQSKGVVIEGLIDASPKWGSAWIDLAAPRSFKKGERLKLTLGGSGIPGKDPAKKVVIRLLAKGEDPNQPTGIITPTGITVPENRVLEIDIPADFANVVQISVLGGNPWQQFNFGANNGPAKLIRAELLHPAP